MERSRDLQTLRYLPKNSLSAPHLGIKLSNTSFYTEATHHATGKLSRLT